MKLLVAGDVLGQFDVLYRRVGEVQKKAGPFDALFCVGQFFDARTPHGASSAKALSLLQAAPIPTYFIGAGQSEVHLLEDGGHLSPNVRFFGRSGVASVGGLVVAYLSGRAAPKQGAVVPEAAYDDALLQALVQQAQEPPWRGRIDVLLTVGWPEKILCNVVNGGVQFSGGESGLARLAKALRPRYHFAAAEGVFYARPPYRNVLAAHVTRFVGLAAVAPGKEPAKDRRWLYALNVTPVGDLTGAPEAEPPDTTENPFLTPHELRAAAERRVQEEAAAEEARLKQQMQELLEEGHGHPSTEIQEELEELLQQAQREGVWPLMDKATPRNDVVVQVGRNTKVMCYISPGALETKLVSWHENRGGKINIDVKGPPMGANRELRTYIAKVVGVLPIDVQVDPGSKPREKVLNVTMMSAETVRRRIKGALGQKDDAEEPELPPAGSPTEAPVPSPEVASVPSPVTADVGAPAASAPEPSPSAPPPVSATIPGPSPNTSNNATPAVTSKGDEGHSAPGKASEAASPATPAAPRPAGAAGSAAAVPAAPASTAPPAAPATAAPAGSGASVSAVAVPEAAPRPPPREGEPMTEVEERIRQVLPGHTSVFVQCLAAKSSTEAIAELFGRYGTLRDIQLFAPRGSQWRSALLEYLREEDAEAAIYHMVGYDLDGVSLQLKLSRDKCTAAVTYFERREAERAKRALEGDTEDPDSKRARGSRSPTPEFLGLECIDIPEDFYTAGEEPEAEGEGPETEGAAAEAEAEVEVVELDPPTGPATAP